MLITRVMRTIGPMFDGELIIERGLAIWWNQ